jgi:hypothetical protein
MTETEVRALVCEQFLGGDTAFPLEADADFLANGICDSLGLVTLASVLQRRIAGLAVADPEITRENLGSIHRVCAFVRRKTQAR